jgi:hypothetical protein
MASTVDAACLSYQRMSAVIAAMPMIIALPNSLLTAARSAFSR